jgi:hypothetical protein
MKCLIDGCERPAAARGLCWSCYCGMIRRIRDKKTTWEQLIKSGLAKEAKHGGRNGGLLQAAISKGNL